MFNQRIKPVLNAVDRLLLDYKTKPGQKVGVTRLLLRLEQHIKGKDLSWTGSQGTPGGAGVGREEAAGDGDQSKPQSRNCQCEALDSPKGDPSTWTADEAYLPAKMVTVIPDQEFSKATSNTASSSTYSVDFTGKDSPCLVRENNGPVLAEMPRNEVLDEMPVASEWPKEGEVVIEGWCLNPRLMAVRVWDSEKKEAGRKCSMWRGTRNWRRGQVVKVKLDKAGVEACYLPV